MRVDPKHGRCRTCGGTLEIVEIDDCSMAVVRDMFEATITRGATPVSPPQALEDEFGVYETATIKRSCLGPKATPPTFWTLSVRGFRGILNTAVPYKPSLSAPTARRQWSVAVAVSL